MFRIFSLFSLLLVANSAFAKRLAVLDFTSVKSEKELLNVMAEMVRNETVNQLTDSGVKVMDKANMLAILEDQGKDASCLEGQCEIEIGRNIGVDYVVTGQMTLLGDDWILNLSLYETEGGSKLKGRTIEAASSKALRRELPAETKALLRPLLTHTPDTDELRSNDSAKGLLDTKQGDFREVHWSALKVKKQIRPKFPYKAKKKGFTSADCVVDFWIDEMGVPQRVGVSGCHKVFHPSTESACMRWRFQPIKDAKGKAISAFFKLRVQYTVH